MFQSRTCRLIVLVAGVACVLGLGLDVGPAQAQGAYKFT